MMCGFAGFFDAYGGLTDEKYLWLALIRRMAGRISHRGSNDPHARGARVSDFCALSHVRLHNAENADAAQPMTQMRDGFAYTVVSDGKIDNAHALRQTLCAHGEVFETDSDAELVLKSYIRFGENCAQKLTGSFAFAIEDERRGRVFLCRDPFGLKPLFYTRSGDRLVFASEIKALFEYPGVQPKVGRQGLCEIFGTAPVRTPGCGVYENIFEVRPGQFVTFGKGGFSEQTYFKPKAAPYTETYAKTKSAVRTLTEDAVKRQTANCEQVCVLPYHSESDADTAILAALLSRRHTVLFPADIAEPKPEYLTDAVIARDLPGFTDTALFSLCRSVQLSGSAVLCSAGADAVFGGYPWFYNESVKDSFPWLKDSAVPQSLLKPEIAKALDVESYIREKYTEFAESIPLLRGESAENRRFRAMTYLSIYGPMMTEAEQLDRFGTAAGLQIRLPYADSRLISLLFNVPKAVRAPNGLPKGLLYDAFRDLLPEKVPVKLRRPSSPLYAQRVKAQLFAVLRDSEQPIHKLLSSSAARALLTEEIEYSEPLFAYLLQVNIWLNRYKVKLLL